jgi:ankyrin repeat protein
MVQPKCWRHLGDADIHANNDQALYWASYNGHLAVVKYLIEHGANANTNNCEAFRCCLILSTVN